MSLHAKLGFCCVLKRSLSAYWMFLVNFNCRLHAVLSVNNAHMSYILGRFGFSVSESEPNFGFLHIPRNNADEQTQKYAWWKTMKLRATITQLSAGHLSTLQTRNYPIRRKIRRTGFHSPTPASPAAWNSLPEELWQTQTFNSFKTQPQDSSFYRYF